MEHNKLIKYDNGQLIKVGKAIAFTNKILSLGEKLDATSYYIRANQKHNLGNFVEAIDDFTKAIEINPNFDVCYNNRGISKEKLYDYLGAIEDYMKAIEITPNYANPYNNRGVSKEKLYDYLGAINDFTKAIEIYPQYAIAFYNRGKIKQKINDMTFCEDWEKAEALGENDATAMLQKYCNGYQK